MSRAESRIRYSEADIRCSCGALMLVSRFRVMQSVAAFAERHKECGPQFVEPWINLNEAEQRASRKAVGSG